MKKPYALEKYESKAAWLEARGLGGSSAASILGKNPYTSKLELYNAIVNPAKEKAEKQSDAMSYGTNCEPLIRKIYALDMKDKYKVIGPKKWGLYRSTLKPYLTASLDGQLIEIGTGRKGILEIKTRDMRGIKDEEAWQGHIPDNSYIQCLHYLMVMKDHEFVELCAKLRYFDYFAEGGEKRLIRSEIRIYHIERKDVQKEIDFLEKKETEFWEKNVMKKIMPAVIVSF